MRGEGETGTTVMILGNEDSLDGLAEGIERYWWPRLLRGQLEVEIRSGRPLRPMARTDLRPFIRGWEVACGAEVKEGEAKKSLTFNRRPLGNVGLVLGEIAGGDESTKTEIALMRGPGMVVEYLEGPRTPPSQPTCTGAFVADDEMEEILRISEPPAHNRWDPRTSRSDRPLSEIDRQRISKIFEKLPSSIREFTRQIDSPRRRPRPAAGCWRRLLASCSRRRTPGRRHRHRGIPTRFPFARRGADSFARPGPGRGRCHGRHIPR